MILLEKERCHMAKIQREKVTVEARSYNYDKRFEEAMSSFEDVHVISVSLVSSKVTDDSVKEVYLVFYEEIEVEETDLEMKVFIVTTRNGLFVATGKSEHEAKVNFTIEFPSEKMRAIEQQFEKAFALNNE